METYESLEVKGAIGRANKAGLLYAEMIKSIAAFQIIHQHVSDKLRSGLAPGTCFPVQFFCSFLIYNRFDFESSDVNRRHDVYYTSQA